MKPIVFILLIIFLSGCGREKVPTIEEIIIEDAETIISFDDDLLASPIDLVLDNTGTLYIIDTQLNQILKVGEDAREHKIIGRQGQGPGEFNMPVRIYINNDILHVIDYGNNRIQTLDTDGKFLGGYPIPPDAIAAIPHIVSDDKVAVVTYGNRKALVALYDREGNVIQTFGEPVVDHTRIWDFTKIKSEINRGGIPDELRNNVLPVFSNERSLWILFQTESKIQKYSETGSLLFEKEITLPEFDRIKEYFFRRNEEAPEATFYVLQYILSGKIVDEELWVLLNTPGDDPTVLLVILENGRIDRKIIFSDVRGASTFTYDAINDKIYFSLPQIASVKAATIGER